MNILIFWRALAMLALLSLIGLIVVWNSYITPVQVHSRSIEILFFTTPLVLLSKGVYRAKRYTMVVTSMVSFVYVLTGVWYVLSVDEKVYGYLLLLFSFCLFLGCLMYVWVLDSREKLAHPERFQKKPK